MEKRIVSYYAVEIQLRGISYKNDPALKKSYANCTSHKTHYIAPQRTIKKKFETIEDVRDFIRLYK